LDREGERAVSGSTIGIKVADGSYYPVLEQGFMGRKELTLTTVADNQSRVQIDLYRGDGGGLEKARYIGSLFIENIPPAPQGAPEIRLSIGLDEAGELEAEADDSRTGESQKFSISLKTLSDDETYEVPDFRMDTEAETPEGVESSEDAEESEAADLGEEAEQEPEQFDFEEPPLTGESYPTAEPVRRKARAVKRGPGAFLIILFCILGALLIAVVGYIAYRSLTGFPVQLFPSATTEATAAGQEPQAGEPGAAAPVEQGQQPASGGQSAEGQAVTPPASEAPTAAATNGISYRIKKGDTLWDISSTYYRNPWLFPRLAKANSIKNPDLIFAGTKIFIPED
jgi:nucleoid-associated protein YgaU